MTKYKELFANNPTKDEVFETSDGYFFWEIAKAQSHASTLEDRKVKRIQRENSESVEPVTEEVALPEIKGAGYSALNFAELKAEAEQRGLDIAGANSKTKLIAIMVADDEAKAAATTTTSTED